MKKKKVKELDELESVPVRHLFGQMKSEDPNAIRHWYNPKTKKYRIPYPIWAAEKGIKLKRKKKK